MIDNPEKGRKARQKKGIFEALRNKLIICITALKSRLGRMQWRDQLVDHGEPRPSGYIYIIVPASMPQEIPKEKPEKL